MLDRASERVHQVERRSSQERPELRQLLESADQKLRSANLSDPERRKLGKDLAEFAADLDEQ
jgi:hypothetical protein